MSGTGGSRGSGARRLARRVAYALATLVETAQGAEEASTWEVRLHAPAADGRWYAVHATVTGPASPPREVARDAPGGSAAAHADYGFSPRERDVLARVARGESTKTIAAALGLSAYTVQDYVRRACEKAGVRTRRELVAKLFVGEPK